MNRLHSSKYYKLHYIEYTWTIHKCMSHKLINITSSLVTLFLVSLNSMHSHQTNIYSDKINFVIVSV